MNDKELPLETKPRSFYPPRSLALQPQKEHFEYLQKLINQNPYKAFVQIHATLQYQMRLALYLDKIGRIKNDDLGRRWSLLNTFQYFHQLTRICFITGIADANLYDKLTTFNRDRNQLIGHINPELDKDISDVQVTEICKRGLELLRQLADRINDVLFGRIDKKK
jgi:hypothetical protein